MKEFEIWSEGYAVTGNSAEATYFGTSKGKDFREACRNFFSKRDDRNQFDYKAMTYWGCRLFDNEGEARKAFG